MADIRQPVAGEMGLDRRGVLPEIVDEGGIDEHELAALDVVRDALGNDERDEAAKGADHHGLPRAHGARSP